MGFSWPEFGRTIVRSILSQTDNFGMDLEIRINRGKPVSVDIRNPGSEGGGDKI